MMKIPEHQCNDSTHESMMTPLARSLMQDQHGILRDQYCHVFEVLQLHASANLRQPMSVEECAVNQSALEIAEIAAQVIARFWDRCHAK
ncbi:hypothetical protein SAMN04515617_12081 [Collimonas sp. OK242]|jgi:hypothetical protein|uniref:hypothetical protein n=1 Tax=Collimonas sp. OK242 TaxID=1798195 RepID=UPI00089BAE96|nr:hypothetical protein [Collimonas sp. OK242]SDY73424.1 hypothetical protein SAMN04515617_12081 [Collimonas sp. OK242]